METLAALGIFLTAAGVILTGVATVMNYKRQAARSQGTEEFQRRLAEKSEEIAKLNQEIAGLAKESQSAITGGDSFCKLMPLFAPGGLEFSVLNSGKYPLYDVQIQVTDQEEVQRFIEEHERKKSDAPINGAELSRRTMRTVSLGNLQPSTITAVPALRWSTEGQKALGFLIQVLARNGSTMQQTRIVLGPGGDCRPRLIATRIQRTDSKGGVTVLEESTSRDFPRRPDGEIDWSYVP